MRANKSASQPIPGIFVKSIASTANRIKQHGAIKVFVGIPSRGKTDSSLEVIRIARQGLGQMKLDDESAVIFTGSQAEVETITQAFPDLSYEVNIPVYGLSLDGEFEDRGWSIRGILEIANQFKVPLLLLEPDLTPQDNGEDRPGEGFSPYWVRRLLDPVMEYGQEVALAKFDRHPWAHPVESLLVSPLVTGVFGFRLMQPTPGVCALSQRIVRICLGSDERWHQEVGTYGFYPWLVAKSIVSNAEICEVSLGLASFRHEFGKLKQIFRQVLHILLEQVSQQSDWWMKRSGVTNSPSIFGVPLRQTPPPYYMDSRQLLRRLKLEFDHFDDTLFHEILPKSLCERIENLTEKNQAKKLLTAEEWIGILHDFILAYQFENRFHRDDIIDGLYPFFLSRVITYIDEVKEIERSCISPESLDDERASIIVRNEAEFILSNQTDLASEMWPELRSGWAEKWAVTVPYLPRLGAWEFIPRVSIVVPQELQKPDGGLVWANQVYKELIDRYRNEFLLFTKNTLGINRVSEPTEIIKGIQRFMISLEDSVKSVFPFDLCSLEGTRALSNQVFGQFSADRSFQLTPQAAKALLTRIPPRNLLARFDYLDVSDLLRTIAPNDALSMAAWFDRQLYLEQVLDVIEEECQPGWFHSSNAKPLVIDNKYLDSQDETRGTTMLTRLAGRVVMSNYDRGAGGAYSHLWFVLSLIKRSISMELFSSVWQRSANEEVDFAARIVSSIRGHWGRKVLSAHNAFENRHQRILAERLLTFSNELAASSEYLPEHANTIRSAAEVYHLSITLPDSTFVPLSAWTWASYSARGGLGVPTPLSSLVERDWTTREFLATYLERAKRGGHELIDEKTYQLMNQGRESEDLGHHLLELSTDSDRVLVLHADSFHSQRAEKLVRPVQGPILEPIANHDWESHYVLNAAAVRLEGAVYIVYRAFGKDEISRLGLAWTKDGVHIDGRLDHPIFEPSNSAESSGCEDPRITLIGDKLFMLYTAYDGRIGQIAMASIDVLAFLERRFDRFERLGLGFPGLANKDAVLYPEKFDGRYVVYHRIDPNMWISYLNKLSCPWPKTGQKIVIGPRPGMMWDGVKIGAGAQPIKTTLGWLNIYHGVDYESSYRLGVLLMDLGDPAKVLYQSPNPILEPEQDFEIGKSNSSDFWVPHVVFTCGAVPAEDIDVVGPEDEILVYYGAADTAIGVAKGKLRDIVPALGEKCLDKRQ